MKDASQPSHRMTQSLLSLTIYLVTHPRAFELGSIPSLLCASVCIVSFALALVLSEIELWCSKYNSTFFLMMLVPLVEPIMSSVASLLWMVLFNFKLSSLIRGDQPFFAISLAHLDLALLILASFSWAYPTLNALAQYFFPTVRATKANEFTSSTL
ncbi:hypothetical protein DSO57_1015730 [Entomophthora muscae]|uniref:Uncharacterized protein n=1 Tax=Entomophthora muscae TaxID=34485 RepID=A0ACC2RW58_9FUNG|nr:hypothetical protein DSO57_1015730 [Entomophthora muscae]